MATGPVMLIIGVIVFAGPALFQILPRGLRPVIPAGEGENLVVVTSWVNDPSQEQADRIDDELVTLSNNYYSYRSRIERLRQTPTTSDEARTLAKEFDASMLIWGELSGQGATITVENMTPTDFSEPTTLVFTIDDTLDNRSIDIIAQFITGIYVLQAGDMYSANTLLNNLPRNTELFGIPAETAIYYAAYSSYSSGNTSQAYQTLQDGLDDAPRDIHLLGLAAVVAQSQGEAESALAALGDIIQEQPDMLEPYLIRGRLYTDLGRFDDALDDLTTALEIEPDNTDALRRQIAVYRLTGEHQQALQTLERLITLTDDTPQLYLEKAALYDEVEQHEAALEAYDAALSLTPPQSDQWGNVLYKRATSHLAMGDITSARNDLNQAMQSQNNIPQYQLLLGVTYWLEDDQAQARRLWESTYGLNANAPNSYSANNLAWELALAGYPEPALHYSDLSLSLAPTEPSFLHTHGYINLALGNYQAAIGDFDDALNYNLSYTPIYRDLGDAFYGLEQWEDAILYYNDYLRLTNGIPEDYARVQQRLQVAQDQLEER